MPEQPQPEHYRTFLAGMDEEEVVAQLAKEAQGGIAPAEASEQLKVYAFNHLRSNPLTRDWAPADPSLLDNRDVQEGVQLGAKMAHEIAMRTMDNNLEAIVDRELSEKTLGTILTRVKHASERIDVNDREIVSAYQEFKRYEEFANEYAKSGKPRNQTEQQLILSAALRGYAEAEKEHFKNFSSGIQELAKSFAVRSAQRNFRPETTAKFAKPGLEAQSKDKERAYNGLVENKKRDVYTVARDAIKSVKKPENQGGLSRSDRENFYRTIHAVERGKIKYQGPTFADYGAAQGEMSDEELGA